MSEELAITERTDAVIVPGSGSLALAMMSDEEFETRLRQLQVAQRRAERIKAAIMTKDVDFGVIPGTAQPTLLKSGAEKLCLAVRLVASFEQETRYGDGEKMPDIIVDTTCRLHLGDEQGPVCGVGVGSANNWERKHRHRVAELTCPKCGVTGTILRSKQEGGWFCWAKRGGCGAKFPAGTATIEQQPRGQVNNPDPFDLLNTLQKMSKKRAFVDATLTTTGTSGLFTQDLEDLPAAERKIAEQESEDGTRKETHPEENSQEKSPVGQVVAWYQSEVKKHDSEPELTPVEFVPAATALRDALLGIQGMDTKLLGKVCKRLAGKELLGKVSVAQLRAFQDLLAHPKGPAAILAVANEV